MKINTKKGERLSDRRIIYQSFGRYFNYPKGGVVFKMNFSEIKFFGLKLNKEILDLLPNHLLKVLEILKNEKDIAIRGGAARLPLLTSLIIEGKSINKLRFKREERVRDLDIILFYQGKLETVKENLISRAGEIMKELKKISIPFQEDGIEPFSAKKDNAGNITEETIEKILKTRDLTINEVVLVNQGEWWMYYSARCWRDLILGIGMLNARDPSLTRRDLLRIVPSNRGFYNLFRALAEGIVEKIWIPKWQIEAHLAEMQRLNKAPLGRYSLLIVRRYKNAMGALKKRWMEILQKTDFNDNYEFWERFTAEQKLLESLGNREKGVKLNLSTLDFNNNNGKDISEMSFSEKIETMIERDTKRKQAREKRERERENCSHKFEIFICSNCSLQCQIKKCRNCTKIQLQKEKNGLRCNAVFLNGNWKADEGSLFSI